MEVCEKTAVFVAISFQDHLIWDAAIGEDWMCEREPSNEHDRYAVCL